MKHSPQAGGGGAGFRKGAYLKTRKRRYNSKKNSILL